MFRFLLAALLFCTGCSPSFITIERSENFAGQKNISKIICIDPQVRIFSGDNIIAPERTETLNASLLKEIARSARKNKIGLEIRTLDERADALYYNELLALKKDLLLANNYQNSPLNFSFRTRANSIQKKVFVYPPLISYDFVNYSQKFGTPYFSYIGLFQKNNSILFYHLIVNTETSETVYRELKRVDRKINATVMAQLVYDSFAMLKKDLK